MNADKNEMQTTRFVEEKQIRTRRLIPVFRHSFVPLKGVLKGMFFAANVFLKFSAFIGVPLKGVLKRIHRRPSPGFSIAFASGVT
jgi:hypothetical protein